MNVQTVLQENVSDRNFIKNVSLNSAQDTLRELGANSHTALLPSGSWVTNQGYNPRLSDHDLTILIPNNDSYHKMEANVNDIRQIFKTYLIQRLKKHKVKESDIHTKHLTSVNLYAPPKVKDIFESYDQFRQLTNLKLSLHDNIDYDKGLWQMKGVLKQHFENEGQLLFIDKYGKVKSFIVKDNKKGFYDFVKQNNIEIPKDSAFYDSHKLKILNEFIEILKANNELPMKQFYKYLQRIRKFLVKDAQGDLFLIANDPAKRNSKKFEKLINTELQFQNQFAKINRIFKEFGINAQYLDEKVGKLMLKELKTFQELSVEMLKRPLIRGFKLP